MEMSMMTGMMGACGGPGMALLMGLGGLGLLLALAAVGVGLVWLVRAVWPRSRGPADTGAGGGAAERRVPA
jgi:hypothetical protein